MASQVATTVWQGSSLVVLAYVVGMNQVAINIASVASVTRKISLKDTGEVISTDSLVVGSTIFNSLQTDYGWTGATGYNFRDLINGSLLVRGNTQYEISYTLVDQAGYPYKIVAYAVTASLT